jgi:hypothetical protein
MYHNRLGIAEAIIVYQENKITVNYIYCSDRYLEIIHKSHSESQSESVHGSFSMAT